MANVENLIHAWMTALQSAVADTIVTAKDSETLTVAPGNCFDLPLGIRTLYNMAHLHIESRGGRFILFGNGGSLAIASHIATDMCLLDWPAMALTDPIAYTSHVNDFGHHSGFCKQLELLKPSFDDILVGLSCSGESYNVRAAVAVGQHKFGCKVVTFSGFKPDNPLRSDGDLNFYTPSNDYGTVQLAHEAILHMAIDFEGGWTDGSRSLAS
jgi:D-sedoheptulose 7-phosphate isomerase